jgi:hypothetical protein
MVSIVIEIAAAVSYEYIFTRVEERNPVLLEPEPLFIIQDDLYRRVLRKKIHPTIKQDD